MDYSTRLQPKKISFQYTSDEYNALIGTILSDKKLMVTDKGIAEASFLTTIFEGMKGFVGINQTKEVRVIYEAMKLVFFGAKKGWLTDQQAAKVAKRFGINSTNAPTTDKYREFSDLIRLINARSQNKNTTNKTLKTQVVKFYNRYREVLRPVGALTRIWNFLFPCLDLSSPLPRYPLPKYKTLEGRATDVNNHKDSTVIEVVVPPTTVPSVVVPAVTAAAVLPNVVSANEVNPSQSDFRMSSKNFNNRTSQLEPIDQIREKFNKINWRQTLIKAGAVAGVALASAAFGTGMGYYFFAPDNKPLPPPTLFDRITNVDPLWPLFTTTAGLVSYFFASRKTANLQEIIQNKDATIAKRDATIEENAELIDQIFSEIDKINNQINEITEEKETEENKLRANKKEKGKAREKRTELGLKRDFEGLDNVRENLKRLSKEIKLSRELIAEKDKAIEGLTQQLKEEEKKIEELLRANQALRLEIQELKKNHARELEEINQSNRLASQELQKNINELKAKLAINEKNKSSLSGNAEELGKLKDLLAAVNLENEKLKNDIQEKNEQLSRLTGENFAEKNKLNKEIEALIKEQANIQENSKVLEARISDLKENVNSLDEEKKLLIKKLETLKAELDSKNELISDHKKILEEVKKEHQEEAEGLSLSLEKFKQQHEFELQATKQAHQEELESTVKQLSTKIDGYENGTVKELHSKVEDLKGQLRAKQQTNEKLTKQIEENTAKLLLVSEENFAEKSKLENVIEELKKELASSQEHSKSLETKISGLEKNEEKLNEELEILKADHEKIIKEVNQKHEEKIKLFESQLESLKEQHTKEIQQITEEIESSKAEVDDLRKTVEKNEEEIKKLNDSLNERTEELKKLKGQLEGLNLTREELSQKIAEKESNLLYVEKQNSAEKARLTAEIEGLRKEHEKNLEERDVLNNRILNLENDAKKLEEENKNLHEELQSLKIDLEAKDEKINHLNSEIEILTNNSLESEAKSKEAEEKLESLINEFDSRVAKLKSKKRKKVEKLNQEITNLKARIEILVLGRELLENKDREIKENKNLISLLKEKIEKNRLKIDELEKNKGKLKELNKELLSVKLSLSELQKENENLKRKGKKENKTKTDEGHSSKHGRRHTFTPGTPSKIIPKGSTSNPRSIRGGGKSSHPAEMGDLEKISEELKKKIAEHESTIAELESQIEDLKEFNENLLSQDKVLKLELGIQKSECENLEVQYKSKELELNEANKKLALLHSAAEDDNEKIELEIIVEGLRKELEDQKRIIDNYKHIYASKEDDDEIKVQDASTEDTESKENYRNLIILKQELELMIEHLKSENSQLASTLSEEMEKHKKTRKEFKQLVQAREKLIEELNRKIEKLQHSEAGQEEKFTFNDDVDFEREYTQAKREIEGLKGQIISLTREKEELSEASIESEKVIEGLRQKIAVLQSKIVNPSNGDDKQFAETINENSRLKQQIEKLNDQLNQLKKKAKPVVDESEILKKAKSKISGLKKALKASTVDLEKTNKKINELDFYKKEHKNAKGVIETAIKQKEEIQRVNSDLAAQNEALKNLLVGYKGRIVQAEAENEKLNALLQKVFSSDINTESQKTTVQTSDEDSFSVSGFVRKIKQGGKVEEAKRLLELTATNPELTGEDGGDELVSIIACLLPEMKEQVRDELSESAELSSIKSRSNNGSGEKGSSSSGGKEYSILSRASPVKKGSGSPRRSPTTDSPVRAIEEFNEVSGGEDEEDPMAFYKEILADTGRKENMLRLIDKIETDPDLKGENKEDVDVQFALMIVDKKDVIEALKKFLNNFTSNE